MDSNASHLSSPKYGYDFVVATTQVSINSMLVDYLKNNSQPVNYLWFLADPKTQDPSEMISLDELKKRSNGVDPFQIDADTKYDIPEIAALTQAMFVVGIKIQLGIPPGVMPKDLPPIVTLGSSVSNVIFRMYCSEFTVIQNTPPGGGFGKNHPGYWNVWSQPSGTPWAIETNVDLMIGHLDEKLDTPFLKKYPELKERLRERLKNMSGSAFSIQQLLFDLDSAVLQSAPRFSGLPPGTKAEDPYRNHLSRFGVTMRRKAG